VKYILNNEHKIVNYVHKNMETLYLLVFLSVAVIITIAFTRKYIFARPPDVDISKLRDSLIHGGHGSLGKLTGKIELEVGGQLSGSAAVCISRDLSVMHWWRATGQNGTNLLGNCIDGGEVTARSIVAAVRLWGKWWEKADSVIINSSSVKSEKMKTFVREQIEDSQNKFGVRVVWQEDDNFFSPDPPDLRGGQDLVQQLVRGEGAGQAGQGLHNINLR
jgi:hypothetical protein